MAERPADYRSNENYSRAKISLPHGTAKEKGKSANHGEDSFAAQTILQNQKQILLLSSPILLFSAFNLAAWRTGNWQVSQVTFMEAVQLYAVAQVIFITLILGYQIARSGVVIFNSDSSPLRFVERIPRSVLSFIKNLFSFGQNNASVSTFASFLKTRKSRMIVEELRQLLSLDQSPHRNQGHKDGFNDKSKGTNQSGPLGKIDTSFEPARALLSDEKLSLLSDEGQKNVLIAIQKPMVKAKEAIRTQGNALEDIDEIAKNPNTGSLTPNQMFLRAFLRGAIRFIYLNNPDLAKSSPTSANEENALSNNSVSIFDWFTAIAVYKELYPHTPLGLDDESLRVLYKQRVSARDYLNALKDRMEKE